jgi:capsular exopolysaccharide synthesis family protein
MNETITNNNQERRKRDVISRLRGFLRGLQRLWILVLVLTLALTALSYYRVSTSYTPVYVADATVSVEVVNGSTSSNKKMAEQMAKIFPYILSSGALSDVIAEELGTKSVPGSIKASNIGGTNLLTFTVTSGKAENSYNILQSVLKNYPDTAQYVVGQTRFSVIDESGMPKDTGRTTVVRGSIKKGAALGLAVSMILVALHALAFRTVSREDELRSFLNVPCLGTLPTCKKRVRREGDLNEINILYDANRQEYVEAMRLIRTRLERQMKNKKVLMVTSSVAGEGKSTVAANLAVSMALKGKKVILVDCDLRNPSTGRIFNLKGGYPGLVAVLNQEASLDEALVEIKNNDMPTGVFLLPGADKPSRLVEILGSESMKETLQKLRDQADVVILDTPPSAMLVDAMMLVRHVDAVAYVVMSDYARRRTIFDGVEEMTASGAPVVGCILNGGKTHTGRYGYYGYYGYKSRYGYGYYGEGRKKSSKKAKAAAKSGE